MRCNSKCYGSLKKGEKIKIVGMKQVFTLLDFTIINQFDVSLILTSPCDKKLFITRRLKEIMCINCVNFKK